jgi:8-oxo-dGTP pyrophosphatase MutT (NUDIX family)
MLHDFDTRYFRAGVGTVIYNQAGEVAIFKRATAPVGVWEFQQGGIDIGEDIEVTLWRELQEEIGLLKEDIAKATLMPGWTVYEDRIATNDATVPRYGQAHRWFFLQLSTVAQIDITKATEQEISEYRLTTFDDAISLTLNVNKKPVYQALKEYFYAHINQ